MYVFVNRRRNLLAKGVQDINMCVGKIAAYQLMQVCQAEYFRQLLKPVT